MRALALSFLILCLARVASAQPSTESQASFSPQLFHPAPGPADFVTIESARTLSHKAVGAGLYLDYARTPLSILTYSSRTGDPYGVRVVPQEHALSGELWVGVGLWERLQIAVSLPMTLYQIGQSFDGDNPPPDGVHVRPPRGYALGDPRLYLKVRLYGKPRGFNLAFSHWLSFPVGNDAAFGGERHFRGFAGEPRLLAEWIHGRLRVGLSVGFLWRVEHSRYFSAGTGHQLTYGGAVGVDVIKRRLRIIAELYGHHDFSSVIDYTAANPLELDVSARVFVGPGLAITAGIGTGVIEGVGSPTPRAFLGLSFEPKVGDRDVDGIDDPEDACPDVAEDRDGYQDSDGCPDLDDDNDTIPDRDDRCPQKAEDFDRFQDDDGCPEPDNDRDGIDDIHDGCPLDPEDHKGARPNDGCPADKSDGDGDHVPDSIDKCPNDPEDADGWEDADGCPDPDNDGDDIPDPYDECPDAAEDVDGVDDADGCPDAAGKVKLKDGEFKITGSIGADGSVPSAAGQALLDVVAKILVAKPKLEVRVEGYWDTRGSGAQPASQALAEAARQHLATRGVAASRMVAVGYGVVGKVRRIEIRVVKARTSKPAAAEDSDDKLPGEQ